MRQRVPRQAKRYLVNREILELNGQPARGTILLDLSAVGARLEGASPLSPRYPVHFTFTLPGLETSLRLGGQVVWQRPLVTAPGRYQMGVKFHAFNWDLDRLLRENQDLTQLP